MKGFNITESSFEDRLAYDRIFVDYFNAFLSLPAFPKVVQYDVFSGAIRDKNEPAAQDAQPSQDAETAAKQREQAMQWVKKERLPLFLKTRLYCEFKLCRLLLRKIDNRGTAHASSRRLGGYSRGSSSTLFSPVGNQARPSSHTSNHSWPGVVPYQFGRRPLGSATSMPPMLKLGLDEKLDDQVAEKLNELVNEENKEEKEKRGASPSQPVAEDDARPTKDAEEKPSRAATGSAIRRSPSRGPSRAKSVTLLEQDEGLANQKRTGEPADGEDDAAQEAGGQGEELFPEEADENEAENEPIVEFDDDELDEAQTEAEVKSITSRHKMSLHDLKQEILGSLRGLDLFKEFLANTLGIHLLHFWLDAESYRDSTESEPEDTLRMLIVKLFREMQDKYKNYLTADAKEQIDRALKNGGLTQDLFARTQYDVLRRLRSYWIPRFLVHVERNEEFRENFISARGLGRPLSGLSFIPTLSLVHSLPPLGEWCQEVVRASHWTRDLMIRDNRNKSARRRLTRIVEEEEDLFASALAAEKSAGCPFKRYLENVRTDDKRLLASLNFWLDVADFTVAEKRSGDRYLRLCNAWAIFNHYISQQAEMNIGLPDAERSRLEKVLHTADDLPLALFKPAQEHSLTNLKPVWDNFKKYDEESFRAPSKGSTSSSGSAASHRNAGRGSRLFFSPTTGRWVRRHPGSSPSERRHRLYTSLAMAEEIDASRGSRVNSPAKKVPAPKKSKMKGNRKKSKATKNVTFDKKKVRDESDEDDDDAAKSTMTDQAPAPTVPDFVDVVENKGTMSAFKQYVQNMEGRNAMNQLLMYLEIEQYNAILPAKKVQKTQQATHIFKTYFDPSSRRSVGLPTLLIAKVEGDRPTSPIFTEAQQFVLSDVKNYFKSFFKHAHESNRARDGDNTPNTPGSFHKMDTLESSQSFLQFYRRRTKKSKSTGRSQPTKEDKENMKRALGSTHGRLSLKMEFFRRYLQSHGEPDGFPRLENDLMFYLEVQKFKELFSYMDDVSLNRKVEAIIECFLDSATPPWLQVDIGAELASKIIHKAQVFSSGKKVPRDQKDPALFDEAQSTLFKELLPYWAGFCKHYKPPEDKHEVKLPPTKQEKVLQKRYAEFLKFPTVTHTIVLPPVAPTPGYSRSEMSFSVSDGAKWKDTKDPEITSVASSPAGSVANGVSGDLLVQQNANSVEVSS